MSAYVISEVEVIDPTLVDSYRTLAAASTARHGGRYIVRGGAIEAVEGKPVPKMLVVVEFPTMEQARAWYRSPDYVEALKISHNAMRRRLILVEGVANE